MTLIEAAHTGAKWMRWWLDQYECDCDGVGGHHCGREQREEELRQIEAAIEREQIERGCP